MTQQDFDKLLQDVRNVTRIMDGDDSSGEGITVHDIRHVLSRTEIALKEISNYVKALEKAGVVHSPRPPYFHIFP